MDKIKIIIISIVVVSITLILIGVILIRLDSNRETGNIDDHLYSEQIEDFDIDNDIVYDTDNMMLISDYDTFYTIEKIVKQIVTKIYNEQYRDVLKIMSKEFLAENSQSKIKEKLKRFNEIISDKSYNITDYSKILYQVYERNSHEYDCLLDIQNKIHYVLIYLNKDNMTYEIRNFILSEDVE